MGTISAWAAMALINAQTRLAPVLGNWAGTSERSSHATGSGGSGDIGSLLNGGGASIEYWASIVVVILGVIALLVGAYMLVSGLISHGKKQTSWVVVILLFVVGGVLLIGGWDTLVNVAGAANSSISSWSNGSFILPHLL